MAERKSSARKCGSNIAICWPLPATLDALDAIDDVEIVDHYRVLGAGTRDVVRTAIRVEAKEWPTIQPIDAALTKYREAKNNQQGRWDAMTGEQQEFARKQGSPPVCGGLGYYCFSLSARDDTGLAERGNCLSKTITIIASAIIFTVLGLITGIALNWFCHKSNSYTSEFAVFAMLGPTLGGAFFGAAVGAYATMMAGSNSK